MSLGVSSPRSGRSDLEIIRKEADHPSGLEIMLEAISYHLVALPRPSKLFGLAGPC